MFILFYLHRHWLIEFAGYFIEVDVPKLDVVKEPKQKVRPIYNLPLEFSELGNFTLTTLLKIAEELEYCANEITLHLQVELLLEAIASLAFLVFHGDVADYWTDGLSF